MDATPPTDEPIARFTTPLSDTGHLVVALYISVIGIMSIVGNGMTLVLFYKIKELKISSHIILLTNLCVCNLVEFSVGFLPTAISSYAGRYLFGDAFCVIQGFTCFTLAVASINTLVMIMVYRYVTICKPHLQRRLSLKFTCKVLVVIWIYSLIWTTPPLFGWNRYIHEPFETSCSIDWVSSEMSDVVYKCTVCVTCFAVQVGVLVYCCCGVLLKRSSSSISTLRRRHTSVTLEQASEASRIRKELKVHNITLFMVMAFIVVWLPYAGLSLWTCFGDYRDLNTWIIVTPTMFAKLSCVVNPMQHFMSNECLRRLALEFVRTSCRGRLVGFSVHESRKTEPDEIKIDLVKDGVYLRRVGISELL